MISYDVPLTHNLQNLTIVLSYSDEQSHVKAKPWERIHRKLAQKMNSQIIEGIRNTYFMIFNMDHTQLDMAKLRKLTLM